MDLKQITFCFAILFITCLSLGYSQETIQGIVYNTKDSTGIAGASVYFDGTNIGVSTDLDGKFKITKNNGITSPLIISSLGFKTLVAPNIEFKTGATLKIYLKENTETLEEVFIETDPWTRKRKLGIFRREFLGNTYDAALTKIQNEEAIKLRYIPSKKIMVAYAEEPLVIINKHLGYKVRYNLENFKVEFSTGTSGLTLVHLVYYEGYLFFDELRKKPSKKQLKNREKTYQGSSLHFMRSLAYKKLHENEFRIFHEKFEVPPYKFFQIDNEGELTSIRILEKQLSILYKGIDQSLIVAQEVFHIDQWGNHSPPTNVIFGGEMGNSRIARTLPTNYGK